MARFDQLACELLSCIVNQLGRKDYYELAATNKQCYSVVAPLIWRQLCFRDNNDERCRDADIFLTPNGVGQHVRLIIMYCTCDAKIWTTWIKYLPNLEQLVMINSDERNFQQLGRHCPRLCKLVLRNCGITYKCMEELGQHCNQLQQVLLDECHQVGYDMFEALASCPLETVYIMNCDLMNTTTDGLDALVAQQGLKQLWTWGTIPFNYCPTYTPTVWPQLTHLVLNKVHTLVESDVLDFVLSHSLLEEIRLDGGDLTDATLDAITQLQNIQTVSVCSNPSITASGLLRLVLGCPRLTFIRIQDCRILGKDFPQAEQESLYKGDAFERMPLDFLSHQVIDAIRTNHWNR